MFKWVIAGIVGLTVIVVLVITFLGPWGENKAPMVKDIPDQTITQGESFATFNLDDYVNDVEVTDADITWNHSTTSKLNVSIDSNHVVTIQVVDNNWCGEERITFTAEDTGGKSGSDSVLFTVKCTKGVEEAAAPKVVKIDFPQKIFADGKKKWGKVYFKDPDGDVMRAEFEVVEAKVFDSFEIEPKVKGEKEGSFDFFVKPIAWYPQEVTLKVTLIDSKEHTSEQVEFSFEAILPES